MDVAVSELRAHLSAWLGLVRNGEEIVVTDRGVPVARLIAIGATATIDRLQAEGVINRPERAERPKATGQRRPRARGSVADLVSQQRS